MPSRFARLRNRYAWLDRLVRAADRYVSHQGYQAAASITYFTVLCLLPLLLVALSVTSFVLAGQPGVVNEIRSQITEVLPPSLSGSVDDVITGIIDHRIRIGAIGLAVALYSGWNWMNALRDSLTAMWDRQRPPMRVIPMVLKDILALLGLAGALLVSFGLTSGAGWLGTVLLRLVGWSDTGAVHGVLVVASVLLAVVTNWLVFIWVLAKLPREPVEARSAIRGALAAAVGFELLKWLGNIYLTAIGRTPLGVTFGWLVGLLVFIYLVARLLLLVAAWTAVGRSATPRAASPRAGYGTDVSREDQPEPTTVP
ncbi:MAG TPA: YhjD/YihY/BrkB family envelope integrity protein [Pseudonocardiaceae bacterium]|nr:YhjD/YihY/BrkB family envelope integrity protein [Pseudonocardiaceae bacterium]